MAAKPYQRVAAIIRDAGGEVVGRTRLQKTAYFLDVAGYGDGFEFRYRHFGPYSDEVAESARTGALLGVLTETVKSASWGGNYSVYNVSSPQDKHCCPEGRRELASRAAAADAIVLELAATAVFLHREGHPVPWFETGRRKPQKSAEGRLEKARSLLTELSQINVRIQLPDLA